MKKFNYKWTLKDAVFTKDKGKVFSCFACGGGSTMGYKLAGYDVIGMNEIDPKMANAYIENHNPKYSFIEGIQTLKNRSDLPKELYNLDILDGSPPCSSFSMAGNRSKDWGKEKKFKEGQVKQVLDTLFFDFIDLAKKLQPKVVVAENVKGILSGEAIKYVKKIYDQFNEAGYFCQHFVLDSSDMGIPQRRERVFFICLRKDLAQTFLTQKDLFSYLPKLTLKFKERKIPFLEVQENISFSNRDSLIQAYIKHWENAGSNGRSCETKNGKTFGFFYKAIKKLPLATITTGGAYTIVDAPKKLTTNELLLCGSFPLDYNFLELDPQYLIGMSVPPVMIANISDQIYTQWLQNIN